MKRGEWAEDARQLAGMSTDGVIRTSVPIGCGVAPATIVNRCLPGGPWQCILPGLVLLHNGPPSEHQRLVAALAYGGGDAMITGIYGLSLLGYRSTPTPIHLLLPHDMRRRSVSFVEVERTRRMPDSVDRFGLPVASLTRCAIDAVRRSRDTARCLDLLSATLRRGETSVDELAIELAECSTRGTALPRRQLARLGRNAASVGEVEARELYDRSGLPDAVANVDVLDSDGRFVARPDLWLDDVGMAWEIDSLAHHLNVPDHESTMLRRSRMQSHGIIVVSHLPRMIRDRPALVIDELRAAYATASARPRPNVYSTIGSPTHA